MKNYVKEYKGHEVPEGAEEFGPINEDGGFDRELFYKDSGTMVFSHSSAFKNDGWRNTRSDRKDLIPLPEAQQEWMPNKTIYWVAKVDKYGTPWNFDGPHDNYEDADSSIKMLNSLGDDIHTVTEMKFKPLKTQQEKDREANLKYIKGLQPIIGAQQLTNHEFQQVLDIYSECLVNAGFTAPKAADNENL